MPSKHCALTRVVPSNHPPAMKRLIITLVMLLPILASSKETAQVPAQGFTQWIAEEFEDEQIASHLYSQDADPDKDGLSNLMEYALDTDPLFPTHRLPAKTTMDASGIAYTYSADNAKSDIRYVVESSRDLRTWQPVASETIKAKGTIELRTAKVAIDDKPIFLRLTVRPTRFD